MVASQRYVLRNYYIYEDLATFPHDNQRRELFEGDLIVNPAPFIKHQRISGKLQFILQKHLEGSGQGELLVAPTDVRLGDNVFEPDLLVVLKGGKAVIGKAWVQGPPDLVVEILSPSSEAWDRGRKSTAYARAGVLEYWIVDPERRQLERFVLEADQFVRAQVLSHETFSTQLMPGLSVDLQSVWPAE
jgi:Uma2 family endonuclease